MAKIDSDFLTDGCARAIAQVILFFLKAWFVMLLWNALMPSIFSVLPVITYWQSAGLMLLSGWLFNDSVALATYLSDINQNLNKLCKKI